MCFAIIQILSSKISVTINLTHAKLQGITVYLLSPADDILNFMQKGHLYGKDRQALLYHRQKLFPLINDK
jgi:subtilisin-like proprotein convertase family protein